MTFKQWKFQCLDCKNEFKEFAWDSDVDSIACLQCGGETGLNYDTKGQSAGVIGDEIDVTIRHGICHEDGSPKRYRSLTELRRAANKRGWTIDGDTPKPYRVNWDGHQERIDGTKAH